MAQAIVDPEELRRFATHLRGFISTLTGEVSRLHGQFNQLGSSWRDQEHRKFAETFEQTAQSLARFVEQGEQFVTHLHGKAEAIDEYQRR